MSFGWDEMWDRPPSGKKKSKRGSKNNITVNGRKFVAVKPVGRPKKKTSRTQKSNPNDLFDPFSISMPDFDNMFAPPVPKPRARKSSSNSFMGEPDFGFPSFDSNEKDPIMDAIMENRRRAKLPKKQYKVGQTVQLKDSQGTMRKVKLRTGPQARAMTNKTPRSIKDFEKHTTKSYSSTRSLKGDIHRIIQNRREKKRTQEMGLHNTPAPQGLVRGESSGADGTSLLDRLRRKKRVSPV